MNIVQLTPGAAGMYCGACMRDNALVASLRKLGHDTILLPLYTPLTLDEPDNGMQRIFFGGVNVFLQQKAPMFRKTPKWLDNPLDRPELIRFATNFGIKTSPEDLGELTVSMLRGENGYQRKELDKLIHWMKENTKPDIICLSNMLLSGVARALSESMKVPVLCTLQGEDYFLDGLPETHRGTAWELLRENAQHIHAFVAVSRYYGETMISRMSLPKEKVHTIYNGIDLTGFAESKAHAEPTIGFLARMAPEKGLKVLAEAFGIMRQHNKIANLRLRIGGSVTAGDKAFVESIRESISQKGLSPHVDFLPNLSRSEKIQFLQSLWVLSVPAAYGESFGLYVLEALACGVPVVQPKHGAFPELIEATGGGILCAPNDPEALAHSLEELLLDEARRKELGRIGREKVIAEFGIDRVARDVAKLFETARAG